MNVLVVARDGAMHRIAHVSEVFVLEPGGMQPPAAIGRLVLMAMSIVAWMPEDDMVGDPFAAAAHMQNGEADVSA